MKKTIAIIVLTLFAPMAQPTVTQAKITAGSYASFSVMASDKDGNELPGATITVGSLRLVTNKNGVVVLTLHFAEGQEKKITGQKGSLKGETTVTAAVNGTTVPIKLE